MAEASRTDDTGITLRIKFKSETIDKFVDRYGVDLSPGGIFIRTREPLAVGTKLAFEFTLFDGAPLMAGQGAIAWVRDGDAARPGVASGMGIRFERLLGDSQATLNKLLAERAKRQGAPQVRYTAPLMEAFRTGEVQVPLVAGSSDSPFKESPSAIAAPPVGEKPSGPTPPGAGDWSSEDKTEIAALPPSFYFDKANKALAEEAAGPGKGPTPSRRADDPGRAPAAPGPGSTRVPTPAFGTPRSGTPAGTMPTPPSGPDRGASTDGHPTPFAGVDVADIIGGASAGLGAADTGRITPLGGVPPAGGTPTPVGIPPAQPRAQGAGGGTFSDIGLRSPVPGVPLPAAGAPSNAVGARKSSRAGVVIAVAAVVAVGGIYLLPRLMSEHDLTKPADDRGAPPVAIGPATTTAAAPAPVASDPAPAAEPAAATNQGAAAPGSGAAGAGSPAAATTGAAGGSAAAAVEPAAAVTPDPPAKPTPPAPPAKKEAKAPAKAPARTAKALRASKAVARSSAEPAAVAVAAPSTPSEAPKPSPSEAAPAAAPAPSSTVSSESAPAPDALYWLNVKSSPSGAEVFIDGQPEGRTPFQRRIFDVTRSYAISIRRAGFEPLERTVTGSDDWIKKGNVRELTISARLKAKEAAPAGEAASPASTSPAPASPPVTPPAVP